MHDEDSAPEADVQEQRRDAADAAVEPLADVPEIGDRPEADVLEQAELVEPEQVVDRSSRPDDVSEADWLEQTVGETTADDDRR